MSKKSKYSNSKWGDIKILPLNTGDGMTVTINTDASWSPRNKVGTYAFWIVCNMGKVCKSGILKGVITSPHHAELACIANAFHCLFQQGWPGIKKIVLNTDSLNSIHVLNNDKAKRKRYDLDTTDFELLRLHVIKNLNFKIELKCNHVRSHVSTETPRQWVNEWADKEAKRQLQLWHKKRLNEENKVKSK